MKKVLFTAAALALSTLVWSSGAKASQTSTPAAVQDPAAYQEMVNKYCVTCHNEKAKIPAGAPLALDKANLKDPGSDAAVWEKVVRKLGVGAMPPRNSPTPGAEELNRFRSTLISSLDSAAARKNYPGRY